MSVDFIDSSIFVYLFDETDIAKRNIASGIVKVALETGSGCISHQVVQETLNVVTRQFKPAANAGKAQQLLSQVLVPLWRVMPNQALYEQTLDVQARYRFSFHDSMIVAAALAAGCTRLYSEDLQHGQRIDRLTITNPFAA